MSAELPVFAIVDLARDVRYEPGVRYVRKRGVYRGGEPVNEYEAQTKGGWDGEECCGEKVHVTYGIGAPCGGYAMYGCCVAESGENGCGRVSFFVPSRDDEE